MTLEEVVASIDRLEPMPDVAVRLLEASSDPDADMNSVARLIERDASMTANLLKLCNSSFYGFSKEVSSVKQAAGLFGLKKVAQLAITVLSSRYLADEQPGYALPRGELYKHSIISATTAEIIARQAGYNDLGGAFTAGLLQDIGKVVIADKVGEKLDAIMEEASSDAKGFIAAEKEVLGFNHPEVGARLLERWNFPAKLVESVLCHHNAEEACIDPDLARISQVADALTMAMGIGMGVDGMFYHLPEEVTKALGITEPQQIEAIIADLSSRLSDSPEILQPPRPGAS